MKSSGLKKNKSSLWQHHGVAALEFALLLPLLLLMLIGMLELAYRLALREKLDRAAQGLSDFIAKSTNVTGQIPIYGQALADSMEPIYKEDFGDDFGGTVFLVVNPKIGMADLTGTACDPILGEDYPCVLWNEELGNFAINDVGNPGDTANMFGLATIWGEGYSVVQLRLWYEPLLDISANWVPAFQAGEMSTYAIYKVRAQTIPKCDDCNN